jgi:hypothetical protein
MAHIDRPVTIKRHAWRRFRPAGAAYHACSQIIVEHPRHG